VSAKIAVRGLRHEYVNPFTRERVIALDGVDLEVPEGEFLSVVGPSGCGKSTLLGILAGLIQATRGEVLLDGRPVVGPGPDRGVVFQEFAILPWRTVERNIAHGLEIQGVPKAERATTVRRFVELVGLKGFERKYPHELSGGMKQRVAVARGSVPGRPLLRAVTPSRSGQGAGAGVHPPCPADVEALHLRPRLRRHQGARAEARARRGQRRGAGLR
jgi:ABC-type nitrate/sulfonate/bicarbonate transport system ATPase subunit